MNTKYVFEIDCTIEQTIRVGIIANNIDDALDKLNNENWDESTVLYSKLVIDNIDKQEKVNIDG